MPRDSHRMTRGQRGLLDLRCIELSSTTSCQFVLAHFTRVTACTLALSPYFVTCFTEGFNRFVTSTIAPVASGWSGCRVGLSPTGKAPPLHGARHEASFASNFAQTFRRRLHSGTGHSIRNVEALLVGQSAHSSLSVLGQF
jgi:hypothetical protein